MATVTIRWQEISDHEVTIDVPDDVVANPDDYDFSDTLAELDNDGFTGLVREDIEISPVTQAPTDITREFLMPHKW
jgi:hypothetical protein